LRTRDTRKSKYYAMSGFFWQFTEEQTGMFLVMEWSRNRAGDFQNA
jgi:hypothetical protein